MSRIGKKPITVPAGVEVKIDGNLVSVKGPKGQSSYTMNPGMSAVLDNGIVTVSRELDIKAQNALHGLTRTLIANMVTGVSEGFSKELEIQGVGYRAAKQGKDLVMNLGYSHQVIMSEIEGISIEVPAPNKIVISGPDKQRVGQFAANVREKRPPEPYKGKGIRYVGEYVVRKEGKAGKGKK